LIIFYVRIYAKNNIMNLTMRQLIFLLAFVPSLFFSPPVPAEERISVAVASNYILVFKDLAAAFEKKTSIKVESTYASSGTLYSQIINGAPYDIFLSADEERPRKLFVAGRGEKYFIYARGLVSLWSADKAFCQAPDWRRALEGKNKIKLAVANPDIAPYGMAAKVALQQAGLWDGLKNSLVNAQDVAHAFQYAATGAVDACFCAASSTASAPGQKGCFYDVPDAPDIIQAASVLKHAGNRPAVKSFAAFLASAEAEIIRKKYGYR
jgi:molybdate transport system substrate-binding protein